MESYVIQTVMIASTLHHHLSSLFVTEAVVGLRESTLLNTITVKMTVFGVVNMVFMQCHLQQV